tara:strand:+ start:29140 stop:29814 length:675 start_codon:yes stop_codon:yes gene_type:complete
MSNVIAKALLVTVALFCFLPKQSLASDVIFDAVMGYCKDKACKSGAFYYHFEKNVDMYCAGVNYINSRAKIGARTAFVASKVKDANLPANISLLPLVESSYNPNANSSAGAAGMWQLKADTARDVGLVVNGIVDERYDVGASTRGAIKYIKWLRSMFDGDLDLAIIAYNAGVGRVQRLIKEYGTRNPWLIAKGLLKGKEAEHYLARYYGYSLAMYAEGVCGEDR